MNQDLRRKLQITPDKRILFINTPEEVSPQRADGNLSFYEESMPHSHFDVIIVFVKNVNDLAQQMKIAMPIFRNGDSLWFGYPKKSSKISSDIGRDDGWDLLTAEGLLPVRQIAFDENWSLLRFRRKNEIASLKRGMEHPGIDSSTKTVIIPEDLKEALFGAGRLEEFEARSFTFRKEAVLSVVSAKREETRNSRIEKIIQSLGV